MAVVQTAWLVIRCTGLHGVPHGERAGLGAG